MLHVCYQYVKFCQSYRRYVKAHTPVSDISRPSLAKKANPFSLDLEPLSDCCLLAAERELMETPENIEKGFLELRQLLAADSTIHFDTNDDFLRIFLRPCKYNAKEAHELVVQFYILYSIVKYFVIDAKNRRL